MDDKLTSRLDWLSAEASMALANLPFVIELSSWKDACLDFDKDGRK